MLDFIKKQNIAIYLTVAAFVLTLVGVILTGVSSGVDGYALAEIGGIVACAIIAMVLMAGRAVLANMFGSHNVFTLVAGLAAMVLLMVAFTYLISGRAVLASAQFTYESGNETGWMVLYESIAGLVMFFISAILLAVGAFFKDKPKAAEAAA